MSYSGVFVSLTAAAAVRATQRIVPRTAKNRANSPQMPKTMAAKVSEVNLDLYSSSSRYNFLRKSEDDLSSILSLRLSIFDTCSSSNSASDENMREPSNDRENGAITNKAILYIFHAVFFKVALFMLLVYVILRKK